DSKIIDTLRTRFIPAVGDDWYRRRQNDLVGEFFRSVANQGPRKGEGGSTRQGLYILTSSGKLLAFRNSSDPKSVAALIERGLAEWAALEAEERKAKPFEEKRPDLDERYARTPPEGGLIIEVRARELDLLEDGAFCKAQDRPTRQDLPSIDHLWLTQDEWRSLVPAKLEAGVELPVPEAIARRIARFHLVDNTRGEPNMWTREEIRALDMKLRVGEVSDAKATLVLEGKAHLETRDGARGFEPQLRGTIELDRERNEIRRFDAVAVGLHWGAGTYTGGARPGRTPLGIAFRIAPPDDPATTIPPQAARATGGYYRP